MFSFLTGSSQKPVNQLHNIRRTEDLGTPASCSPPDPLLLIPRNASWFRPNSLKVLYEILENPQFKNISMVVGNTSSGQLPNGQERDD